MKNYFSIWQASFYRKMLNDSQPWRRNPGDTFQYGFFYAQMVTVYAIIIVFSTTIPLVAVAGVFFLSIRHVVDSFNLLTVHRKEIESTSEMVGSKKLTNLRFGK
jgi:hypothetical protein